MDTDSKGNLFRNLSRREMLKYSLCGGLTVGLYGSICLGGFKKQQPRKKPNIILITVDTLRADHLGCYGYSRNTSPNLDQLAADAMLFENCVSHAPVTSSSFASILSGFLPHETKVFRNFPLPKEIDTLEKILQRNGYKTAGVVGNFNLRRKAGWDEGFTIFDDTMSDYELVRRFPERTAKHTTDRVIEILKELNNEQFFFWIHYQDPHGPFTPPEPFDKVFQAHKQPPNNLNVNISLSGYGGIPSYQKLGENRDYHYYVSQYDGEIRYNDEQLGRLIDTLKKSGLYDDALILFTADHGEGMGKHDYYFAHGENLYNDLIHVPLIIKYGKDVRGRRSDFVQHIDIVPTILEILGIEAQLPYRGKDLRRKDSSNKEIFAEMDSPLIRDGLKFSLISDGLKLIYTPLYGPYELFNLKTDPYEEHNLVDEPSYQKQFKYLKGRLQRIRFEDRLGLRITNKPLKLTEDEREKLRTIGY